jgi:putative ABC transport system substrate-binding protein
MQRREFITLVVSTIGWPSRVWAQQANVTAPIIGFLGAGSADQRPYLMPAIRSGLNDTSFADAAVEYRFADGYYDRLHDLAHELLLKKVSVIIADGATATVAAKAATEKVPIVFITGADPIRLDLVASFSRPNSNITGLVIFANELIGKRLEILRELLPKDAQVALLVNPRGPNVAPLIKEALRAAEAMDQVLHVTEASIELELDTAFASFRQTGVTAILVAADPFFDDRREKLIGLSDRYAIPAIYQWRQFTEAGGLISYGPSLANIYRQSAVYAGRILKGAKPSDLPVEQPTTLELVINLQTAKSLGINIPSSLLIRADTVIE